MRKLLLTATVGLLVADRTERRGERSFALIVDMVRIASQAAGERDLADSKGQCVVQTKRRPATLPRSTATR
jgi:hypothetical protein